jgi:hypothetical protein
VALKSNINPGSEGIPLKLYKTIQIPGYIGGISKAKDFDPICHLEIKEPPKEGEEEDEEDQFAVEEDKVYERQRVEGLHEHWL